MLKVRLTLVLKVLKDIKEPLVLKVRLTLVLKVLKDIKVHLVF